MNDLHRRRWALVVAGIVSWASLPIFVEADATLFANADGTIPVFGISQITAIPLSVGGFFVVQGLGTPTEQTGEEQSYVQKLERLWYWLASFCYGLHVVGLLVFLPLALFPFLVIGLVGIMALSIHLASLGTYFLVIGLLIRGTRLGFRRYRNEAAQLAPTDAE